MLNNEMKMLQRENQYYKTQNENLKKEVEKLSKIIKKIQGKLSNVDYQINEYIKSGSNLKNLNSRKKNNSNLYLNFKSKDKNKDKKENNKSLFQLNPNYFLIEENEKQNNDKSNNKSTKNKKLIYYLDNNILKDNGNKMNNKKEYEIKINNKDMNKKCNKTAGYNSFDLHKKMYIDDNKNNNDISVNDNKKLKTPNSIIYKNFISKNDKNKKNNLEMVDSQPRETSFSCQDNNNKIRSYSSKHPLKENIISNNKTTDEIDINNFINKEDLNVDDITSSKHQDLQSKICLTYDNLFNKKIARKKNTYNSFRGKILNKNLEIFFKNEKMNKSDEINFFLKKCKMLLNKDYFEQIVKLCQDYKDRLFTDEKIIIQIQRYLENSKELIELFSKIFGK